MLIKIEDITIDSEIQLETRGIDNNTVAGYVEAMSNSDKFPPIIIYDDGTIKWLSAGFHRVSAARFLGITEIEAEIRQGTKKDAMIFAATDNAGHGRPMSQAQKQEAANRLFELINWSDPKIAQKLAVGNATIWRWREEWKQNLSSSYEEDTTRTATRGDTTYQINVSNIGKSNGGHHDLYDPQCPNRITEMLRPASQPVQVTIFSHESVEYYTPTQYVEAAREVMEEIDLDPASCEFAQEWIQAKEIYTIKNNGLNQSWFGRVWLNPPYSKTGGESNQGIWAQKLITEYLAGRVPPSCITSTTNGCWRARRIKGHRNF